LKFRANGPNMVDMDWVAIAVLALAFMSGRALRKSGR
jgi:hypothetical protein